MVRQFHVVFRTCLNEQLVPEKKKHCHRCCVSKSFNWGRFLQRQTLMFGIHRTRSIRSAASGLNRRHDREHRKHKHTNLPRQCVRNRPKGHTDELRGGGVISSSQKADLPQANYNSRLVFTKITRNRAHLASHGIKTLRATGSVSTPCQNKSSPDSQKEKRI